MITLRLIFGLIALLAVLPHTFAQDNTLTDGLRVPAFTAYSEPDADAVSVSEKDGLTGWTQVGTKIVWYGMLHASGPLHVALAVHLPPGETSTLRLTVAGKALTVQAKGGADAQTVDFGMVNIAASGPVRFQLDGLTKTGTTFGDLDALLLSGPAAQDAHFNLTTQRGAPSVHLWYPAAKDAKIAWFYNEITVKTDPIWSYYMACGFSRGYFGIQVNSPTERRIIFSVWDSGKEPTDRANVQAEDRVQLIAKGDKVFADSFGHEGTGGHSHLVYLWKTGTTCRFLVSAQPDGTHTIYSGYFYFPEKKRWGLIASFRAPKDGGYLRGLYSFNEDFNGANGQRERRPEFGPQWIKTDDGAWTELREAHFTHTANGEKTRLDRGAGVIGKHFFLFNGGFAPDTTPVKYGNAFTRPASGKPPTDIVLPLSSRH